jgi:hypothetical protein
MPDMPFMAPPENVEREYQGQAPQAGPPAGEAFSPPPQQPSPPPQRAPQSAPDRRAPQRPPQSPQSPQMRPQSQPQAQPSLRQPQPKPLPQQRGAPPAPSRPTPPQPPPLPRPSQIAPREGKAPAGPQLPQATPGLPPRGAPLSLEDTPAKKLWPWKAIIKWGVVTLVILGIAVGAWMWLAKPNLLGSGKAPGQPGAKSTNQGAPSDPNDPRSRKADRLPGPS